MASSSPARAVCARGGRTAKSMTSAAGSRVSRPEVAGLVLASGAGPRTSRPDPSSRKMPLTALRPSGVPSCPSRALIS
jgi:hypothetical protein